MTQKKYLWPKWSAALEESKMEYGGITPIGLPEEWPILVDSKILLLDEVLVGGGKPGYEAYFPWAYTREDPKCRRISRIWVGKLLVQSESMGRDLLMGTAR